MHKYQTNNRTYYRIYMQKYIKCVKIKYQHSYSYIYSSCYKISKRKNIDFYTYQLKDEKSVVTPQKPYAYSYV
jgi:hypothetical protein